MSVNGHGREAEVLDIGGRVEAGVGKIVDGIGVDAVFGTPEKVGEQLVLPAATVMRGGGFGFGAGTNEEEDERQVGGGGGGGGYALGRPVAVVVVDGGDVRVKPVLDLTHLGITVLATVVALLRVLR
jgi:uncharacterized spore protein YtfJ